MAITAPSVARRGDALVMTAVRRCLSAIWLAVLTCIATASIAHADALARGTAAYSRGDYNRAARELEPLVRRGNAKAFALLGFLYEHGFGEPKAYPVAAGLYAQGAARGDPFGQAMLGLLYDKGYGVPQDFVLAYKWLDLAAAHATGPQRDAYARFRDAVGSKMSPNEIAEGQRLATYWTAVAWVPPGWADSRPRRE